MQLFFVAVAVLMVYLSATLNVGYCMRTDLLGMYVEISRPNDIARHYFRLIYVLRSRER